MVRRAAPWALALGLTGCIDVPALSFDAPPDSGAADAAGSDAAPRPDGAPVICGPDEVLNAAGRCVSASADMGPERDACPYGTAESFCAQGTQLVDGKCEAICGAGTYWDPSCANGCGACQPDGVPTCAEAAGGKESGKASSGCTLGGRAAGGPLWLAGLALAASVARRRRENRARR